MMISDGIRDGVLARLEQFSERCIFAVVYLLKDCEARYG